jgi:hypothetical protein
VLDDPKIRNLLVGLDRIDFKTADDLGNYIRDQFFDLLYAGLKAGILELLDEENALEVNQRSRPRKFGGSFTATGTYTFGSCVWTLTDEFTDVQLLLPADGGNGVLWAKLRTTEGPVLRGPAACSNHAFLQERTTSLFVRVETGAEPWRFENSPGAGGEVTILRGTASSSSAQITDSRSTPERSVSAQVTLSAVR